jgi:superfamily II DNA or RNA helicase
MSGLTPVANAPATRASDGPSGLWTLRFPLKPWQEDALSAWHTAGRRGVIEAATGTGKTMVALAAIEGLYRKHHKNLRVAIVVPTKVLAQQWWDELHRNLGVLPTRMGQMHSAAGLFAWRPDRPVLITVVNTARTQLPRIMDRWHGQGRQTLLIVDECHRVGSPFNAQALDGRYDYSLGLSATPERDDNGHDRYVYPSLGPALYRYPLLAALNDKALAPVVSVNLYVDFSGDERTEWDLLSQEIGKAFQRLTQSYHHLANIPTQQLLQEVAKLAKQQEPLALRIQKLLSDRRTLLASSHQRSECRNSLLDWLAANRKRSLVFHESIATATESHKYLSAAKVSAGIDHSQLVRGLRDTAMSRFRTQHDQVLVAVRALDEGVDVPDASVAVIAEGSRSVRQRIQRFGRVLRPVTGKEAIVFTILVRNTPEEGLIGGRDATLLGPERVRHHRWPGTTVSQAAAATGSTFRPEAPLYSVEEALTILDLGLALPDWGVEARNRRPTGGYSVREATFSKNAWYTIDEVLADIGIPLDRLAALHRDIRRSFRRSLDSVKAKDPHLIHSSEIEAIRRTWHHIERNRTNLGRSTRKGRR